MSQIQHFAVQLKQFAALSQTEVAATQLFLTVATGLQLRGLDRPTAVLAASKMSITLPIDLHKTDPDGFSDLCDALVEYTMTVYASCVDAAGYGGGPVANEALINITHNMSVKISQ